jgi:hypothetical protein
VSEFGENILIFLNTTLKVADIDNEQLKLIQNKLNKKKFKNIILFGHHAIWTRQPKINPLVDDDSASLGTSNHNFHKILNEITLNNNQSKVVFVSGERDSGKNELYSFSKNNNAEYYAIGFGNTKLLKKNKALNSALKIELSKKGNLLIDKVKIN